MTPNGLPPGTLLGAFVLESTLGRGGMGAVYRARNRITGDARAVKVILPELAARQEFVGRFVREIRLAMAVEHPNLVKVFEPGMDGEQIFLPMELLEGESLAHHLKREGPLPVGATDRIVQAIGSALVALHAKGILHRDVKPSNVFMAREHGTVIPKLLDLGAGKDVEGADENTSTGLAIGSPHYMAPEQAAGRKDLDGRVDEYALATLAYQIMTGARPYENDDTGHVLAKVLSGAPFKSPRQVLQSIPASVDAVILRAMSRAREDRFATVSDFLVTLHQAAESPSNGPPSFAGGDATRAAPLAPPVPFAPLAAPVGAEHSGTMSAGILSRPPGFRPGTRGVALISGGVTFAICIVIAIVHGMSGSSSDASVATGANQAVSPTPHPVPPPVTPPPPPVPATAAPPPPPLAAHTAVPAPPSTGAPTPETRAVVAPPRPVVEPRAVATSYDTPPTLRQPRPVKAKPAATDPGAEPCHPTPGSPCL